MMKDIIKKKKKVNKVSLFCINQKIFIFLKCAFQQKSSNELMLDNAQINILKFSIISCNLLFPNIHILTTFIQNNKFIQLSRNLFIY